MLPLLLSLALAAQDPGDLETLEHPGEADWAALAESARSRREALRPGDEGWTLASAELVQAVWELSRDRDLAELEEVANAVLASPPAEPGLRVLRAIERVRLRLGWTYQARRWDEDALEVLGPLLGRPPLLGDPAVWAGAELAGVEALLALKRTAEARRLLHFAAMRWSDSPEGAVAQARLVAEGGPYFGRYRRNERHAALRAACLEAVPRARARVSEAMGSAALIVERAIVGFADRPPGDHVEPLLLSYDWRRPRVPPVIVVMTEELERDALDPEAVLAAGLTRAVLAVRLGRGFDELPAWLIEGIAGHVAGTLGDAHRRALERRFLRHGELLLERRDYWGRPSSVPLDEREAALRVRPLTANGRDVERLVDHLCSGETLEAAFEAATGEPLAGFIERADVALRRRLRRRVNEARPALRRLFMDGPGMTVEHARELLEEPLAPFEAASARLVLARTLMGLGRWEEGLAAWDELLRERRAHPDLVETALVGRTRALLALGREGAAREALRVVGRTTTSESVSGWAEESLRALGR